MTNLTNSTSNISRDENASAIDEATFVVTDVETTGSDAINSRVIEVACVTVHGGEIIDRYSSLVNSHQLIPEFIARMTGISNRMIYSAPESDEIFPVVRNLFSDERIFVAHNVNFDFSFMQNSFMRQSLPPLRNDQLCTLKLARRLLPNLHKKNVGALATHFGIPVRGRHRALGDAEATAFILLELIELARDEHSIETIEELLAFQNKRVNIYKTHQPTINRIEKTLINLPGTPGVYYFKGKSGEMLYIGKAKSLKKRIKSHFQNQVSGKRSAELIKSIYSIEFKETDTELEALLLESREIKVHKPRFNIQLRKYKNLPFLKITNEEFPKVIKTYDFVEDGSEYFGPFSGRYYIDSILENLQKIYKLRNCNEIPESSDERDRCFYLQIDRCNGSPCRDAEDRAAYQREVEKVRLFLKGQKDTMIEKLESKMLSLSENLEFEKAATLRDEIQNLRRQFINSGKLPNSADSNSMIVLHSSEDNSRTVDIYYIRRGSLCRRHTIGKKAPAHEYASITREVFFNGHTVTGKLTPQEVEEMSIVNRWLRMNKDRCEMILIKGSSFEQIVSSLQERISLL